MAQELPNGDVIAALVRKAQEGDTAAFGQVYDEFFDPIYRYVSFRIAHELVEDLVADIFVKAWEKLHTYVPRAGVPFGAWLFRIARHAVIDLYRGEQEILEVPEDMEDTDDFNRADTQTHRNDTLRVVREAMENLPTRYREVLTLCYIAELPHSEVARVLKMTEGGVRILKMRALRKFASFLPTEWQK